jgi:hypothetical protein
MTDARRNPGPWLVELSRLLVDASQSKRPARTARVEKADADVQHPAPAVEVRRAGRDIRT